MGDTTTKFEAHDDGQRLVWSIVGPRGGFHIWAQVVDHTVEYIAPWVGLTYGGVEVHYKEKPYSLSPDEAPIKNCWLTGCDCWPDGSSMQYEDQFRHLIESALDNPERLNDYMFAELEHRYKDTWGQQQ